MSTTEIPAPVAEQAPAGPPPPPRHRPVQIAPDTFVVQAAQGEGVAPVAVHLNAMVIRGPEPIIVDTGVPALADRYLEDLWSLVDPTDVRWVFLSHDDIDHFGNLEAVMAACPNATLLTSWFQWERMGNIPFVPPWRMRWVETGEALEINGRTYLTPRPPLFDSPTTRGLLDTGTGVYWASDCFATSVPRALPDVGDMDHDEWIQASIGHAQLGSPWLSMVDPARFHASVDEVQALGMTTIASCHSPTITGANVEAAFAMVHDALEAPRQPSPGQELLDEIIAMATAGAPPATVQR